MKKLLLGAVLAVGLVFAGGCATMGAAGSKVESALSVVGSSPEAQIVNGANGHKLAIVTTTELLRNNIITAAQAKHYRDLLDAPNKTLHSVLDELTACRKRTGTTEKSSPDPCRVGVADVIRLALDAIGNVRRTLDAKK